MLVLEDCTKARRVLRYSDSRTGCMEAFSVSIDPVSTFMSREYLHLIFRYFDLAFAITSFSITLHQNTMYPDLQLRIPFVSFFVVGKCLN